MSGFSTGGYGVGGYGVGGYGVGPCPPNLYLADSNGTVWQIWADDSDDPLNSVESLPPATTPIPQFPDFTGRFWQLGIDTSGELYTTVVPAFPAAQNVVGTYPLIAPSGVIVLLAVDENGQLFTFNTRTGAIAYVTGQLTSHGPYPVFSQPGGIGTPTFPQQQSGEQGPVPSGNGFLQPWTAGIPNELGTSLWVAGCGHWFNHWDVKSVASCAIQAGLMCCPLCGYIQRIIVPYSAIHSESNFILIA